MNSAKYSEATDRNGKSLLPGDRVRFKLYPSGIAEGVIAVSERTQERLTNGQWVPALVIVSDGRTYPLHSKVTSKIKESA